ncbi:S9 family peptidase [Flavobacterium lacus]|nr:prolyl oligopeptidase family serine peptidase [Flavobacterium lacus]
MQLLVLLFVGLDASAQEKKTLSPADYDRWYGFHHTTLSSDGQWLHYIVENPKGEDTLVVRKVNGSWKQIELGGAKGQFSPRSDWFVFMKKNQLYYQSLVTGSKDSLAGIDGFFFSKGGTHLIGERKKEKELVFIHLATAKLQVIASVASCLLSLDRSQLALVQRSENRMLLSLLHFSEAIHVNKIADFDGIISGLAWNTRGNGLAFFESVSPANESEASHVVHYLTFKRQRVPKIILQQSSERLPSDFQVPQSRLFFSTDDGQLFFDVMDRRDNAVPPNGVLVWSSQAKVLPPPKAEKMISRYLMCWHLRPNTFVLVNDEEHPLVVPATSGKHALVIDKAAYLPHFEHQGIYVDVYLQDLKTGGKKLIVQKINNEKNHIHISPQGNYITWFADKNWWIYDVLFDKSRCLTCFTNTNFNDLDYDRPGSFLPNDKPHWTIDDKAILLTDFYDVWLFSPDGKSRKRLTNGFRTQGQFRLFDDRLTMSVRENLFQYQAQAYNLEQGIILKEVNRQTLAEGISVYQAHKGLQTIVTVEDKIDSFQQAGDTFVYNLSDFDKSPELVVHKANRPYGNVVQRSNAHQKEYHWGKSALIHYTANEATLKGALFYPANYNPEKEYPMVVKIYERMSFLLRKYVKPSSYSTIGFNVTNYTQAGYFVLLPDIAYTVNKPGESALECVLAAVEKAVGSASIDAKNIGLFGHSFAGFEVSYIATESHRFKTIVSGSGWHDLVGTYLSTDDYGESNIWRFDTQQLRITAPYYSTEFLTNSPVLKAYQISTPMLLWSGTEDLRVNWRNSVAMQFALWRLGKPSTLLLYPKEGHVLEERQHQYDLSIKTLEWYNHYLKGEPKPEWVE